MDAKDPRATKRDPAGLLRKCETSEVPGVCRIKRHAWLAQSLREIKPYRPRRLPVHKHLAIFASQARDAGLHRNPRSLSF